MSVDIGNLQRLSDDQVNSRLKAYSEAGKHLSQRVPDQLANAKLALRRAGAFLGSAIGHGCVRPFWV